MNPANQPSPSHQILACSALALASPATRNTNNNELEARYDCAYTCSGTCYTQSAVDHAMEKGYSLYSSGQTEGRDHYPHQYHDYEGIDFPVEGPYYEFPILESHYVYRGGPPGADRVIFNANEELAGVIMHDGGDGFAACSQ